MSIHVLPEYAQPLSRQLDLQAAPRYNPGHRYLCPAYLLVAVMRSEEEEEGGSSFTVPFGAHPRPTPSYHFWRIMGLFFVVVEVERIPDFSFALVVTSVPVFSSKMALSEQPIDHTALPHLTRSAVRSSNGHCNAKA